MNIRFPEGAQQLLPHLHQAGLPDPQFAASTALWLEACGYPGLKLLAECLSDATTVFTLQRDAMGLDLQNISCVRIGPAVVHEVQTNGRVFLRNVRHGLYLLPASVEHHFGIGCPVDPSFALGGERSKNPYAEKLDAAHRNGIDVDAAVWQFLAGSI